MKKWLARIGLAGALAAATLTAPCKVKPSSWQQGVARITNLDGSIPPMPGGAEFGPTDTLQTLWDLMLEMANGPVDPAKRNTAYFYRLHGSDYQKIQKQIMICLCPSASQVEEWVTNKIPAVSPYISQDADYQGALKLIPALRKAAGKIKPHPDIPAAQLEEMKKKMHYYLDNVEHLLKQLCDLEKGLEPGSRPPLR